MASQRSGGELAQALAVCRPAMRRFAYTLVGPEHADDLVQDAAERAWRKQKLFDPTRGSAQAWLLAIVADRARQRWRRTQPAWQELHPEALVIPESSVAAVDLTRAVTCLPARQRAAVVLHYFVDLPIADIAELLGCAPGTVKSQLHDARMALEKALGDSYAND
ncbi:RNA polymerase sigma24 factor [Flexivirga endophytica]|uniref:RNA polymerase sigma24 factor n=1 Tax=Flexivirga endophytica TaxID=1849103 RepID=A0A916SYF2_9MICO|nr:RNA polymerase sigma factor [Flexivirga endophytica]GGB22281.1 RNA polymerase sigma24 factor [Flexivirga endophytica]GHB56231.1 RNA polymerase sigma24 factor [Flexivirga endophytica]